MNSRKGVFNDLGKKNSTNYAMKNERLVSKEQQCLNNKTNNSVAEIRTNDKEKHDFTQNQIYSENKNLEKNNNRKNRKKNFISLVIFILIIVAGLFLFFKNEKKTIENSVITFNSNGGTFVSSQIVETGEKALFPPEPERYGYAFIGWKLNDKTYDFSQDVKKDILLEAIWQEKNENQVLVKFDSSGGTTILSQVVTKGESVIEPTPPSKKGYIFMGWELNNIIYDFNTQIAENIKLVAKWQKDPNYKEQNDSQQKEPQKEEIKEEQKPAQKDETKEEQKPAQKEETKEEQQEETKEEQQEEIKEDQKPTQKEEPTEENKTPIIKNPNPNRNRNTIHFISTCVGDAILIESYGVFGLVDAANAYNDGTAQANSYKECTGEHVKEYLSSIGVKYLDFVVATHSHSDHIGGMVTVAKKYVNENTTYFYKKFSGATDNRPSWDNEGYYNRAIKAVKAKKANLVDLTNKTPTYTYGNFKITFINTASSTTKVENNNSIGTIIQLGNKKIFLASDIESTGSNKIASTIGKVDVLKLNHHGNSGATYKFISTLQPKYIVITNESFVSAANAPVGYAMLNYGAKAYLTGKVSSAIRLNVTSSSCTFENTGGALALNSVGWIKWGNDYIYIDDNGKLKKGWVLWNGTWYYLNKEGIMLKNTCSTIGGTKYCFNSNGDCTTGC